MASNDNENHNFNYAGPGAVVGIQCQNITVGSIRMNGDDITVETADNENDS